MSLFKGSVGLKVFFVSQVYKNLQLFMENKSRGDDLFDRLTVSLCVFKSSVDGGDPGTASAARPARVQNGRSDEMGRV